MQGIIAAFLFSQFPTATGLLYTADLVGTALGGLAGIFAVRYLGPPQTALALSLLSILIAPVYLLALGVEEKKGRKQAQVGAWQQRLFWVGTLFLLALATLGAWSLRQDTVQQWIARGATPVSGKTMFELMGDPNVESRVVFSGWDEFARTDVVEQAGLETKKYIFTDGGAASYMSSFNGNPESIESLTTDAGYFPFTWGKRNKVLIIGAGGGRDLLIALRGGSQKITAVEINRNIIKAMDQFASFNGNLYRRSEIQLVIGDGRNFVRKANAKYDLIYLPLVFTQAATSSGYGLVENYIFTQEAFAEYFSRLHPNGRLVLKLHGAEDLTKAALTAIELLQKKKANLSPAAAMQHLLIINGMNNKEHAQQNSQPHFPLLIIRPGLPFSATEAKQLQTKAMEMGYEPLYTPWVQKEGVFGSMEDGFLTPAQLIRRANVQLEPASDNKPFFYNVEKGIPKNISLLFLGLIFLAGILILDAKGKYSGLSKKKYSKLLWPNTFFFMGLGMGYIMIELAIMQKLILVYGHPSIAQAVVVTSLLLASGVGSSLSNLLWRRIRTFLPQLVASLGLITLAYAVFLPQMAQSLLGMTLVKQIGLTFLFLLPLGALMGIPFPTGLRLIGEGSSSLTPFLWGINGIATVIGSVLAIILALTDGFTMVLIVGAICYFIVSLLASSLFSPDPLQKRKPILQ